MKRRPKSFASITIATSLLAFASACKDQTDTAPAPPSPQFESRRFIESRPLAPASDDILPGAGDVRSSLTSGDYNEAVDSLLALRSTSTEGRKYTEYLTLYSEVLETLRTRARSDPSAADALARFNTLAQQK